MTVEKLGSNLIKFEAPKFIAEEVQIARKQAEIRKEIAAARRSPNGYADFAKETTIGAIVKAAKQIKKGFVDYIDNIKFNFELLKEKKAIKKANITDLKGQGSKLTEDFNARRAFTAEDNLRIEKENAAYEAEQALQVVANHDKKQGYYNLVNDLDNITTRKIQITKELEQLNSKEVELNKNMDELFPESKQ